MKPNQKVLVQLTRQGAPLAFPNVYLDIRLFTNGVLRYTFPVGATDDLGRATFSYQDLEEYRQRQAKIFLMDYNTRVEDCDSIVEIHSPTRDELLSAHEQVQKFFGKTSSPPWLQGANHLIAAKDVRAELSADETHVALPCDLLPSAPLDMT